MSAVEVNRAGAVAEILLNRPHRRNALDAAATAELGEMCAALAEDRSVRVVVLAGAGAHLCAGWDLGGLDALEELDDPAIMAMLRANHAAVTALRALPQPVVAKARGTTAGFGLSLLAACDLVVAAEDARFVAPEVGLGIVPALVLVDLLALLGQGRAADWLLAAQPHPAARACQDGLVHRLVAPGRLDETVADLAGRMAGHDPDAMVATKRLLHLGEGRQELVEAALAEAVASIRRVLAAR